MESTEKDGNVRMEEAVRLTHEVKEKKKRRRKKKKEDYISNS